MSWLAPCMVVSAVSLWVKGFNVRLSCKALCRTDKCDCEKATKVVNNAWVNGEWFRQLGYTLMEWIHKESAYVRHFIKCSDQLLKTAVIAGGTCHPSIHWKYIFWSFWHYRLREMQARCIMQNAGEVRCNCTAVNGHCENYSRLHCSLHFHQHRTLKRLPSPGVG